MFSFFIVTVIIIIITTNPDVLMDSRRENWREKQAKKYIAILGCHKRIMKIIHSFRLGKCWIYTPQEHSPIGSYFLCSNFEQFAKVIKECINLVLGQKVLGITCYKTSNNNTYMSTNWKCCDKKNKKQNQNMKLKLQ